MARLSDAHMRAFDANNNPVSGARLYLFDAGTTNPANMFHDPEMTTPVGAYLEADDEGVFPSVYVQGGEYKVRTTTETGVVLTEEDFVATVGNGYFAFDDWDNAEEGYTGDAQYIFIGERCYKYDAAGTDLTTGDGRTWTLVEHRATGNVFHVNDYIAQRTGGEDQLRLIARGDADAQDADIVTAGVIAAIDAALAFGGDFAIHFGAGSYLINQELDFSASLFEIVIQGEGAPITKLHVADGFGRDKYFIKSINAQTYGKSLLSINGIRIYGNNSATDPIGIYCSRMQDCIWSDVDVFYLGNTALMTHEIDNSRWNTGNVWRSGWLPTERDTSEPIYYKSVTDSDTITAWEDKNGTIPAVGVFTGMEGKRLLLEDATKGARWGQFIIQTVTGEGASCILDGVAEKTRNAPLSDTISYLPVRCTMTDRSPILEVSADVLTSDYIGSTVIVGGAEIDEYGAPISIMAKIVSVESGTSCTLDFEAQTDVIDADVWFSAGIIVSEYSLDRVDGREFTNDYRMDKVRVEQTKGPAMYMHNAGNLGWEESKIHGPLANAENAGAYNTNLIFENASAIILNLHYTRFVSPEKGWIQFYGGNRAFAQVGGYFYSRMANVPIVEWAVTEERSKLSLTTEFGTQSERSDYPLVMPGPDTDPQTIVRGGGATFSREDGQTRLDIVQIDPPFIAPAYYSNSFRPNWIDQGETGFADLTASFGQFTLLSSNDASYAIVMYNVSNIGEQYVNTLHAGANIHVLLSLKNSEDVTLVDDGEAGKFNVIFCQDKRVTMINDTGARKNQAWHIMGIDTHNSTGGGTQGDPI